MLYGAKKGFFTLSNVENILDTLATILDDPLDKLVDIIADQITDLIVKKLKEKVLTEEVCDRVKQKMRVVLRCLKDKFDNVLPGK